MFSNIKTTIKQLAKNAVLIAESELGSGNGKKKKEKAIEYIVSNLPFSALIKEIISILLSRFIDDAVEVSVQYLHSLQEENQGEN